MTCSNSLIDKRIDELRQRLPELEKQYGELSVKLNDSIYFGAIMEEPAFYLVADKIREDKSHNRKLKQEYLEEISILEVMRR